MKIKKLLIVSVLAMALLGCGKREFRQFVILPDISGSIDRESLEQAFKAIDDLASHLQRGDRLTVVPILGDAEAETSGKILRFEVPTNRQAYDMDLRDFRRKLNVSLKEMQANAIAHPGSKTDILGAVALAEQEFNLNKNHPTELLIILSDFIQEDQQFNFKTDDAFSSAVPVQKFATKQARIGNIRLDKVEVYLGLLKSREFAALEKMRRNAIKNFWIQYFNDTGTHPRFFDDGPGLLKDFNKLER
ncbi:MAG TPA: hypothetical protein VFB79_09245 [Candidatus Angelobacter sp.]|nr:hypothetical protein [Candidatus Angelobacter sp.]